MFLKFTNKECGTSARFFGFILKQIEIAEGRPIFKFPRLKTRGKSCIMWSQQIRVKKCNIFFSLTVWCFVCRNGGEKIDRNFNNCFWIEFLTEKFKLNLYCSVAFLLSLQKRTFSMNHYSKSSTNSWIKPWQKNVTARLFWRFLSFMERLLIVQSSSNSHPNNLPHKECCLCSPIEQGIK